MMNILFNSARYTCEASNTLVKEANVDRKNKVVTGMAQNITLQENTFYSFTV